MKIKINDEKEGELRDNRICPRCYQEGLHNELANSENGLYCGCGYGEHCDGHVDRDGVFHSWFGGDPDLSQSEI